MKDFKIYIKDKDPKRTAKLEEIRRIASNISALPIHEMAKAITSPNISTVKLIFKKHKEK